MPPSHLPPDAHEPPPGDSDTMSGISWDFTIEVLNVFSCQRSANIPHSKDAPSVASSLVSSGYLGATPNQPTIAVCLKTLELYHRLRVRQPNFSIQAFTKVICDRYLVPYRRRFRRAFSDAFDVYLTITNEVHNRMKPHLGQDSPDWRALRECPPCTYELNDEPPLVWKRMIVMDGNESTKRVKSRQHKTATPTPASPTPAPPTPACPAPASPTTAPSNSLASEGNEGDPCDGEIDPTACTARWRAAAEDKLKKMWGIFRETGMFACACRHGLVLWIADMVESGELAKYPLAMVAKALSIIGYLLLIGYDIGCSFGATISHSSLASLFKALEARLCVNAFHGYAHNYQCQQKHHPLVIKGMGLEDLETMERVFSSSNAVARLTRYASTYHRHLFLDMHFNQWNQDKYTNTALMLYNNYVQALDVIAKGVVAVEDAKKSLGVSDSQLDEWLSEEKAYLQDLQLKQTLLWDSHALVYVELLQKLREAESVPYPICPHTPTTSYAKDASETRKLESQRRFTNARYESLLRDTIELEVHMGIATSERWTPETPEYAATIKFRAEQTYHRALDNLEHLVVQRLFEFQRLGISETGMHSPRSQAIRTALNAYNSAAQDLNPPRPTYDWEKLSHYGFLQDCLLLRESRPEVLSKPWSQPAIRVLMKQHLRIQRAREEIVRCNVEIRRLHMFVIDKNATLLATRKGLEDSQNILLGPFKQYCDLRRRVNNQILARIFETYRLDGFTGIPKPGVRKGKVPPSGQPLEGLQAEVAKTRADEALGASSLEDNDGMRDEVDRIVEATSGMSM
ncbi:hypothetical protein BOTBODRAFT_116280 [Botryobasidium botryosum FD-172 SS1]|uniref:CxC1-like cysteine cluster associated with KDZ transposases domain-containing protein n=1 Tax=Botryobasidium botryosum (strain FD-172 SS1) TaxID=930990 RepID=A0A067M3C1_BOTB1|nr:hypothetical protein BOTBODRAFT_116280 [Botryobasidium botryosum FD-172 SS1]